LACKRHQAAAFRPDFTTSTPSLKQRPS
jgi:hypothetical protein